jgi:type I restriction enzyme M protein
MNTDYRKDKNLTAKQNPLKSEFDPIKEWWNDRNESEISWKVPIDTLKERNFDLDIKNPHKKEEEKEFTSDELLMQLSQSLIKTDKLLKQLKNEVG